jgi:hypothetical protein
VQGPAAGLGPLALGVGRGLTDLACVAGLALGPLGLACAFFFPRGFLPGRGADGRDRLPGRVLLFALAGLACAVIAGGARHFHAHWFAPLLLLFPVWFFGRLERTPLPRWRHTGYLATLALAVLGVLVARSAILCLELDGGKYRARDFLYAEQADRAREAGFDGGTLVVGDIYSAGYQRLHFPTVPVHCLAFPACPVPDAGPGPLLVVWEDCEEAWPKLARYLAARFGTALAAVSECQLLEARPRVFDSGSRRLRFLQVPHGLP